MYQNIVLAYDGSLESQQALLNCKDLSQWEHAKVHGPTPTPIGGPMGGSNTAYKWNSLLKKSVCLDVSETQPRLGMRR